jgi:hypothetical protein
VNMMPQTRDGRNGRKEHPLVCSSAGTLVHSAHKIMTSAANMAMDLEPDTRASRRIGSFAIWRFHTGYAQAKLISRIADSISISRAGSLWHT